MLPITLKVLFLFTSYLEYNIDVNKAIRDNKNDNSSFTILWVMPLSNATLTWNLMLPITLKVLFIFTSYLEYNIDMNKAIHDNKNDNSSFTILLVMPLSNATLTSNLIKFDGVMPLFVLAFLYRQAPEGDTSVQLNTHLVLFNFCRFSLRN